MCLKNSHFGVKQIFILLRPAFKRGRRLLQLNILEAVRNSLITKKRELLISKVKQRTFEKQIGLVLFRVRFKKFFVATETLRTWYIVLLY